MSSMVMAEDGCGTAKFVVQGCGSV